MARAPGRKTLRPNDYDQVDQVDLPDIGKMMTELGAQLRDAGTRVSDLPGSPYYVQPDGTPLLSPNEQEEWGLLTDGALRALMVSLRRFRRSYDYWERVTAEFAMKRRHLSQRETAKLLGIGVATTNRWAQEPVGFSDEELVDARRRAQETAFRERLAPGPDD